MSVTAHIGTAAAQDTTIDLPAPDPDALPIARPVIAIEDTRSHGPTTRNWLDISATPIALISPGATVLQLTSQLAIGLPTPAARELRDIYATYHLTDYQLRLRNDIFRWDDDVYAGPLTVAVQRYFPISPLALSTLAYAHLGLEASLASPWLSGRSIAPHHAIQILDGVDSELAGNGWSIRPISGYARLDALACGSTSLELGAEPEAFAPTMADNQYGLRFHAAAGIALKCGSTVSPHAIKAAAEYRGRAMLYTLGQPASYRDSAGIALQMDFEWFVIQLFYRADPGSALRHYGAVGLRLQIGRSRQ